MRIRSVASRMMAMASGQQTHVAVRKSIIVDNGHQPKLPQLLGMPLLNISTVTSVSSIFQN